ncbi:cobalt transporter CbiM [Desulfosudis oleivorans]|uniref:Cobalamin (Vitamin B12) biosynthesis CbiM protein n=1 Tax=Desulfosudis oleivorans (strain DSM 6200 / JCM 39069 / Hxd3) TaxID=96561 RepID=A8ZTE3_DESOH|nr:cobalt transporter CbiM [Desulfosudis oleivorans]ABW67826.1 cobalamin (vitamin B12) biosynthesis CbiM protein [Desulfosudis oleivorans Hxd3]
MHISEGILSWPVLAGCGAVALAGTAVGIRKLDPEKIPRTGMLSAAFFVASLIHVPLGPSSVHLILNGMVGLILGWSAFPAIFVAILLQAVLFQYGGITTLGVNTMIMAVPALLSYYLFRPFAGRGDSLVFAGAFLCGMVAVLTGGFLAAVVLIWSEERFLEVALLIVTAHLPVMVAEGLITGFAVLFLKKVKPDLLE